MAPGMANTSHAPVVLNPLTPIGLRDADSARARTLAYALFSNLLASPFDAKVSYALHDLVQQLADTTHVLPFTFDLSDVEDAAKAFDDADMGLIRRQYSGLFEVGSDGPPVPLRAELVRTNESVAKEEIIRFYEHFNYALNPSFQWAPDHLSILLEFVQTLAHQESAAADARALLSLQLAQRDFVARHIADWMPGVMDRLSRNAQQSSFFGAVVTALNRFIRADLAWQNQSLDASVEGAR
ncbi:MAG: molecular chaperone TorD family protein [Rhodospirillaceae bacterium]|nr:molecular chaperone TorD family protein [Rhodospirillaceae bacterium]